MWAWLKSLFGSKVETRETKFCKQHGTLLVITKNVLSYNEYTGLPEVVDTLKNCPTCDTEE